MTLLRLHRDVRASLQIRPRWPARQVSVDITVLNKLQYIQTQLPAEIGLILTRGFEPKEAALGGARKLFRWLGIRVFRLCYPGRQSEVADIFGSNSHDRDGTHIDISFRLNGRRVRMLPLGVFTPSMWQRHRIARYATPLAQIYEALRQEGFQIHGNATESLQIHCDWLPSPTQVSESALVQASSK